MKRWIEARLVVLSLAVGLAPLLAIALLGQRFGFSTAQGWLGVCWSALQKGESGVVVVVLAALFPALVVGGRSLWSVLRQAHSIRRLLLGLGLASPPPRLAHVAQELDIRRLDYTDTPEVFAFTHFGGVVVSRGLLELLSLDELKAVLLHERCHLERRSPLRALLVTALARGAGFLPVAKLLHRLWLLEEELEADRAAARMGHETVASALLRLARHARKVGGVGILAGSLELRVRALLGERCAPLEPALWRRAMVLSTLIVLFLALTPGLLHAAPLELHLAVAPLHPPGESC